MLYNFVYLLLTGCLHHQSKPSLAVEEIHQTFSSSTAPILNKIEQIQQQQVQQQQQLEQISALLVTVKQNQDSHEPSHLETQTPEVIVSAAQCTTAEDRMLDGRLILGRVEWVLLSEVNDLFKARIDTGATTSSVSADRITLLERDGKKWVKFFLTHDGKDDVPVEAKLVRYAKVRQASADAPDKRPVVRLNVRIGEATEAAEFTLADRSAMTYPVLLGREFLKDMALVDVSKKFLQGRPEILIPDKVASTKRTPINKSLSNAKRPTHKQTASKIAKTVPNIPQPRTSL